MKYVIRDTNDGMMLQHLSLTKTPNYQGHSLNWTPFPAQALHFNYDEAQGVIQFISDVIDWELAEMLEVAELIF